MEYIEQTNGQRIKTKMGLAKYIESQYTQDMFEQDLNDYHSMISFGTKKMGYGELYRMVNCEGFEVEYRKAIDDKATQALSGDYEVVKGLKLLPLDTPCNFTDAMALMLNGHVMWTLESLIGIEKGIRGESDLVYFKVHNGELSFSEDLKYWEAVRAYLRNLDFLAEVWYTLE